MDNVFEVRAHHLLCAFCAAAGCEHTPAGKNVTDTLIGAFNANPCLPVSLSADVDLARVPYADVDSADEQISEPEFRNGKQDYAGRMRDLEVLSRLGLQPHSVNSAFDIVRLMFRNINSLEGICFYSVEPTTDWPECPNARLDSFKELSTEAFDDYYSLRLCRKLGREFEGRGPYCLMPIRDTAAMDRAKKNSCEAIAEANRLFIRPHHLLCLCCLFGGNGMDSPLEEDNLVEIAAKIRKEPEIPVTLVEGCCMVCDPCPAFDPERHMCHFMFVKDQLKDLKVLHRLGLPPGATLPARNLFNLLYKKVNSTSEICGPVATSEHSLMWAPCGNAGSGNYDRARSAGFPTNDQ